MAEAQLQNVVTILRDKVAALTLENAILEAAVGEANQKLAALTVAKLAEFGATQPDPDEEPATD
jgi:hypothetical protein